MVISLFGTEGADIDSLTAAFKRGGFPIIDGRGRDIAELYNEAWAYEKTQGTVIITNNPVHEQLIALGHQKDSGGKLADYWRSLPAGVAAGDNDRLHIVASQTAATTKVLNFLQSHREQVLTCVTG